MGKKMSASVYQIGAANPRLQKVLDALDDIKSKVSTVLLVKAVVMNLYN